jgi:hypothetical protein
MHVDLEAASAGEYLALCDRASDRRELATGVDEKEPSAALSRAARGGHALLVHIPEDCEARIRVFVDEEPPASLTAAAHASRLDGASLAVPSGVLVAAGAEHLGDDDGELAPGIRTSAAIPPGTYRTAAFSTFHWKARHRGGVLAAKTAPADRRLLRIGNALGIGAAIFLVANFFGMPWLGALALKHGVWRPLAVLVALDAVFLACVSLGDRFLSPSPRYRAALAARDGLDVEIPDVVVVLKSGGAPDGAAPAILEVPR